MSTNQLLVALDKLSMQLDASDARRLCADVANGLRAAIQTQERVDKLENKIAKHRDHSTQGVAQLSDLQRQRKSLPNAPLTKALDVARKTLDTWNPSEK